jgi:hypothetical protein
MRRLQRRQRRALTASSQTNSRGRMRPLAGAGHCTAGSSTKRTHRRSGRPRRTHARGVIAVSARRPHRLKPRVITQVRAPFSGTRWESGRGRSGNLGGGPAPVPCGAHHPECPSRPIYASFGRFEEQVLPPAGPCRTFPQSHGVPTTKRSQSRSAWAQCSGYGVRPTGPASLGDNKWIRAAAPCACAASFERNLVGTLITPAVRAPAPPPGPRRGLTGLP